MKKSVVQIIPAQKTDFSQLMTLWKKTGLNLASIETEQIEFYSMLKLNPTSCLVALVNKQIIGSAFGIFNGRRAWIYHLAVEPKWQKQGVGSKLLQATEKALSKVQGDKIRLWVNFTNLKVVPFYEKHGYGVISDAVMMGKNITEGGETSWRKKQMPFKEK